MPQSPAPLASSCRLCGTATRETTDYCSAACAVEDAGRPKPYRANAEDFDDRDPRDSDGPEGDGFDEPRGGYYDEGRRVEADSNGTLGLSSGGPY